MKKLAALTAIALAITGITLYWSPLHPESGPISAESFSQGDWITVIGTVERTLSDDREGSRHQRFILRLDDGRTLLISHNIDVAPRLDGLQTGERLTVHGEYQPNDRGGVVHWTHHDPQGSRPGGYIERQGRRYQ